MAAGMIGYMLVDSRLSGLLSEGLVYRWFGVLVKYLVGIFDCFVPYLFQ